MPKGAPLRVASLSKTENWHKWWKIARGLAISRMWQIFKLNAKSGPFSTKMANQKKKCQQVKNMLGNLCTKGSLWKGKYFYYTKHCLYLTTRQKYRTTEFISVRLMYLCHVLHRLSKYFLMSKICQGVYAKGPPGLLPRTCFSLPLLFRTPATKAFREGHRCNLIQSQPYEGVFRAGINAGMPISLFNTMEYRQYRQLTNSPLVANVTSEWTRE